MGGQGGSGGGWRGGGEEGREVVAWVRAFGRLTSSRQQQQLPGDHLCIRGRAALCDRPSKNNVSRPPRQGGRGGGAHLAAPEVCCHLRVKGGAGPLLGAGGIGTAAKLHERLPCAISCGLPHVRPVRANGGRAGQHTHTWVSPGLGGLCCHPWPACFAPQRAKAFRTAVTCHAALPAAAVPPHKTAAPCHLRQHFAHAPPHLTTQLPAQALPAPLPSSPLPSYLGTPSRPSRRCTWSSLARHSLTSS